MLIGATNTDFYQLRRSVPTNYTDGKCPLDIVDSAYLPSRNDVGGLHGLNYTTCLYSCETKPNCQSFDYQIYTKKCFLSSKTHSDHFLKFGTNGVYTELNKKLWNDFRQSHTLEKINSVGCGVRVLDSYYFVEKKVINDSTAYSTFSFKQNPYHNLVTEAQVDAHSVLDCSRLCMVSSTCTAFSYTNTKCVLKKLV
ncbi:uncharacterized protein LOC118761543 [Octopus sinensis]|uniref:Uncharacterized protein LOC118761475 n=2 Tax=Octopus sinensis TaxID=2607531 RepID=A0A7E6EIM2_9MOLL|nr:uncharacterized protein LOC118761475 [Octopus sinensis]XP_036355461.1 uncharacterized protein LOC118761543 [Octopus sinensis]